MTEEEDEKSWTRTGVCFLCGNKISEEQFNDCRSADLKYGGYTHNSCWDLLIRYAKWRKKQGKPIDPDIGGD